MFPLTVCLQPAHNFIAESDPVSVSNVNEKALQTWVGLMLYFPSITAVRIVIKFKKR